MHDHAGRQNVADQILNPGPVCLGRFPIDTEVSALQTFPFRFEILDDRIDVIAAGFLTGDPACLCSQTERRDPRVPSHVKRRGEGGIIIEQLPSDKRGQQCRFQSACRLRCAPQTRRDDLVAEVAEQQAHGGHFADTHLLRMPLFQNGFVFGIMRIIFVPRGNFAQDRSVFG